jgi:hypothetical protein
MLLVKTKIGPSEIEGIGCFADEFIPEGTAIWCFQEGFDLNIPRDEVEKLSPSGKYQFLKYSYLTGSEIYWNYRRDPCPEPGSIEINVSGRSCALW